jgi:hypothetical protein
MSILRTSFLTAASVALLAVQRTSAATCDYSQPRGDISVDGDTIGKFLREYASIACSLGNNNSTSAGQPSIQVMAGTLVLLAQRKDVKGPFDDCEAAFDNIISTCVENDKVWGGGEYDLGDVSYQIYNSAYPGL